MKRDSEGAGRVLGMGTGDGDGYWGWGWVLGMSTTRVLGRKGREDIVVRMGTLARQQRFSRKLDNV